MKTALITGITGFAGSHLAEYLLANHRDDVKVTGTHRWRSPLDNIEGILGEVELHETDLTDLHSVYRTLEKVRPDYIFHLAAQSFVPTSWKRSFSHVRGQRHRPDQHLRGRSRPGARPGHPDRLLERGVRPGPPGERRRSRKPTRSGRSPPTRSRRWARTSSATSTSRVTASRRSAPAVSTTRVRAAARSS